MPESQNSKYGRTDIWREGKWIDLWSAVHLLSGASVGFLLYLLKFSGWEAAIIALLLFILYEMWEVMVQIAEARANRFMDVVFGMISFLPTFFLWAPSLSLTPLIFIFGLILTINIVGSVFGWMASRKAEVLEGKIRLKYRQKRESIRKRFPLRTRSATPEEET